MTKFTTEYFADRSEQARIKLALTEAIPPGVKYYNLIRALSDVLDRTVSSWVSENLEECWHGKKDEPQEWTPPNPPGPKPLR